MPKQIIRQAHLFWLHTSSTPGYPIQEGWVPWIPQCKWIHQNRVYPPAKQPTRYQQVTRLCTMHLLFIVAHVSQIQTYTHNLQQINVIANYVINRLPSSTLAAPISNYPPLWLQLPPSLLPSAFGPFFLKSLEKLTNFTTRLCFYYYCGFCSCNVAFSFVATNPSTL